MFKQIATSKAFQQRARWIFLLLTAAIILPMVLFFSSAGNGAGPGGGAAGVIFGRKIPADAFNREYAMVRRSFETRLGSMSGDQFEPFLQEQTWTRLILKEEARRRVKIRNEEVARYLEEQPTFQQQGRFAPDLYYRYLRAIGVSPSTFEERIRDDLRIQQLVQRVNQEVDVTEPELVEAYARDSSPIDATLIVIEPSSLTAQIRPTLTEHDIQDYYYTHLDQFAVAPRRTYEYLGVTYDDALASRPPPSDVEIWSYYGQHAGELKRADGSASPLEEVRGTIVQRLRDTQARKQLTDTKLNVEEDLEQGLRFEEIALARGIPIRTIGPDAAAPGVANGPDAAMLRDAERLALGHPSAVHQGAEGVFVVRAVEETPARLPALEEVRAQVESAAGAERSREAARARAEQLRGELAALRQAGLRFEEAVLVLGAPTQHPDPFTKRTAPAPLSESSEALDALMRAQAGALSGVLQTPSAAVIAYAHERLPYDQAQFEQDRKTVQTTLLEAKQREHLEQWLASLRERAGFKSLLPQQPQQPQQ